jgi:hypothetical protein
LLKLSRSLSEEQQRHVRENMTEEELVIFDILTRPAPELSAEGRAEAKTWIGDSNRKEALAVIKGRSKAAGLPSDICNHTFRATGIATFLLNGGTVEKPQALSGVSAMVRPQSTVQQLDVPPSHGEYTAIELPFRAAVAAGFSG